MNLRIHLTAGAMLLLTGMALMVYTVQSLYGLPYVYMPVLLWLCMVEYAVGRACWLDTRELLADRTR